MLKKIIGYSILSSILLGMAFVSSVINHSPWYTGFIILGAVGIILGAVGIILGLVLLAVNLIIGKD